MYLCPARLFWAVLAQLRPERTNLLDFTEQACTVAESYKISRQASRLLLVRSPDSPTFFS